VKVFLNSLPSRDQLLSCPASMLKLSIRCAARQLHSTARQLHSTNIASCA